MKILITGGAGFIGSNLSEYHVNKGDNVTVLDDFSVGQRKHIAHLEDNKNFTLIEQNITEEIGLDACDLIYHLACPASPVQYQKDPLQTLDTIVLGTLNVLKLATKTGARMVYASTSEVYGDPEQHPQQEDYWGNVNTVGERSCYDEGKRVTETYCKEYAAKHDTNVGIVRIFNTYGPRMALDDGRALPNFVFQALSGKPITVFGDGSHTRSFQYIDDLIAGLVAMADKSDYLGPVNLGNPDEEHTVKELAEIIVKTTGSSSPLEHTESFPSDDPTKRRPDITRAKQELGWQPAVTLEQGLEKTVEYIKQQIG